MTREEWIKIYNAKDGTWDKDDLIDKAYEIISSPIKTNYDRIKSMSVEEMAESIAALTGDLIVRDMMKGFVKNETAIEAYKQWLLQEVSENDTTRKES